MKKKSLAPSKKKFGPFEEKVLSIFERFLRRFVALLMKAEDFSNLTAPELHHPPGEPNETDTPQRTELNLATAIAFCQLNCQLNRRDNFEASKKPNMETQLFQRWGWVLWAAC